MCDKTVLEHSEEGMLKIVSEVRLRVGIVPHQHQTKSPLPPCHHAQYQIHQPSQFVSIGKLNSQVKVSTEFRLNFNHSIDLLQVASACVGSSCVHWGDDCSALVVLK